MLALKSRSSSIALLRRAALLRAQRQQPPPRRGMAGGGGDIPVPPQSRQAKFLGEHSPEPEGWELSYYIFLGGGALGAFLADGCAPDTQITTWARNEAAARLRLKEEDGFTDFEFGKHYQDIVTQKRNDAWDGINRKFDPFVDEEEEEADQDDDEDEEQDEDEEDQ